MALRQLWSVAGKDAGRVGCGVSVIRITVEAESLFDEWRNGEVSYQEQVIFHVRWSCEGFGASIALLCFIMSFPTVVATFVIDDEAGIVT